MNSLFETLGNALRPLSNQQKTDFNNQFDLLIEKKANEYLGINGAFTCSQCFHKFKTPCLEVGGICAECEIGNNPIEDEIDEDFFENANYINEDEVSELSWINRQSI